jgi:hypothetical protein
VAGRAHRVRRLIRLRRAYYEPLLPDLDRQFRKLDAQMRLRLEQRKSLDRRLQHMLVAPRPDYLATATSSTRAAWIATLGGRARQARGPSRTRCASGSRAEGRC